MSLLNTLVDRIFIINLKHREDKWKKLVKQLKSLHITNYERFEAILPTDEMIKNDINLIRMLQYCSKLTGVIGCKLSHLKIIEIAKNRGYKSILILEDDAKFCSKFNEQLEQVGKQMTQLQTNWDMLYLGAEHKQKGLDINLPNIRQCFSAYTTSSYIIRDTLYDYVLSQAPIYLKEIDTFYVHKVQKYNVCLAVTPNLIDQDEGISDISFNYMESGRLHDC